MTSLLAILALGVEISDPPPAWIERSSYFAIEKETAYVYTVSLTAGIDNRSLATSTADNRGRAAVCGIVGGVDLTYEGTGLDAERFQLTAYSNCDPLNWVMPRDHHFGEDGTVWALIRAKIMRPDLEAVTVDRTVAGEWWRKEGAWTRDAGGRVLVFAVGRSEGLTNLALARSSANQRASAALCSHLWRNFHVLPEHGDRPPRFAANSCSVNWVTHERIHEESGTVYSLASLLLPKTVVPLAAMGEPERTRILADLSDPTRRERAAYLVGALKPAGGAERLLEALDSAPSPALLETVTWSLAQYGNAVAPFVEQRLRSATEQDTRLPLLRLAAAAKLTLSAELRRTHVLPTLVEMLVWTNAETWNDPRQLGEALAPELVGEALAAVAQKPIHWQHRASALEALVEGKYPEREASLVLALQNRSAELRKAAVGLLAKEHDAATFAPILARATDADPGVREEVMRRVTASANKERALAVLVAGSADRIPSVRSAALWGLVELDAPEAEAALQRALSDRETAVRVQAVRLAAGRPARRPWILPALEDGAAEVVDAALTGLKEAPTTPGLAAKLLGLVGGKRASRLRPTTRARALELLGQTRDATAVGPLADLYLAEVQAKRPDPARRRELAGALIQLDPDRALALLSEQLQDAKQRVPAVGELALIDSPAAADLLIRCARAEVAPATPCRAAIESHPTPSVVATPEGTHLALAGGRAPPEVIAAARTGLVERLGLAAEREAPAVIGGAALDDAQRFDLLALTYLDDPELCLWSLSVLALDHDPRSGQRLTELAFRQGVDAGLALAAQNSLVSARVLPQLVADAAAREDGWLDGALRSYLRGDARHGVGAALVMCFVQAQSRNDVAALSWLRRNVRHLGSDGRVARELFTEVTSRRTLEARLAAAELLAQVHSPEAETAVIDLLTRERAQSIAVFERDPERKVWEALAERAQSLPAPAPVAAPPAPAPSASPASTDAAPSPAPVTQP